MIASSSEGGITLSFKFLQLHNTRLIRGEMIPNQINLGVLQFFLKKINKNTMELVVTRVTWTNDAL